MEPMIELNDETLSAYLDGELDAAQVPAFEAALAADAGARLRLERMRLADARLRAAFPIAASGQDDPLAARILRHAPDAPRVRPEAPRRAAWQHRPQTLMALAAGLAALAVGVLVLNREVAVTGLDPALTAALDELPSGGSRRDGDASTRLVLSFRADDGRWCRVFEQQTAAHHREGLACTAGDGWQVLALDEQASDAGSLRPAGASPRIDALMNQLGSAPVLEAVDEQARIASRWRPDPAR